MSFKMKSIFITATLLASFGAFADGPPVQPAQPLPPPPQQQYQEPYYQQDCGCVPPPQFYQCDYNCFPIVRPLPFAPIMPWFGGGRGWIGGRPGWNGGGRGYAPGYGRGMGPGGFRRMSSHGCEIQAGNNGQYVVLSSDGGVLFQDSSESAAQTAELVKARYEKDEPAKCGAVSSQPKPQDI